MSRASISGKNPNSKPCPRCGKLVSIWWSGKFIVIPRHKNELGKQCRQNHPPRPDIDRKVG